MGMRVFGLSFGSIINRARSRKSVKIILVFSIVIQFAVGLMVKSEIVGWDYCIEGGHPFVMYSRSFGFPFRYIKIKLIYGCLTTPHIETDIDHSAPVYNLVLWAILFIIARAPDKHRGMEEKAK
jgi:hypothetical protein